MRETVRSLLDVTPSRGWQPRVKWPGQRRSRSRSATRALEVLEYFGAARRPLRAIEIAKGLGLHPSSADQLLKTMVDSSHLVFDAREKTYLPSPRLAGFCSWIVEGYGLVDRFAHLLRNAQEAVGGVVTLATANGLFMQILDYHGSSPCTAPPERGLQTPIFKSVHGWAYLSSLADEEVRRIADMAQVPDRDMPSVFETLQIIRGQGFADTPIPERRAWTIAVALPDGRLPYATVLGVTGAEEALRTNRESLYAQLKESIARYLSPAIQPCSAKT